MARALIVGCGCRGRALGRGLLDAGWQVRGTTREANRAGEIEAAGIEPVIADPDRVATLIDQVADVTVIYWLLGSAEGESREVAALHGPRLERMLEEVVDTPVRGFVYEAAGPLDAECFAAGAEIVRAAGARWRIPFEVVDADPGEWRPWVERMIAASERLTGQPAA